MEGSQPGGVMNVVFRGPSVASNVQAVLNADDIYNPDLFLDEIADMQSNNDSIATELELMEVGNV